MMLCYLSHQPVLRHNQVPVLVIIRKPRGYSIKHPHFDRKRPNYPDAKISRFTVHFIETTPDYAVF
jgi:hypothetical protein